jgi:hypothetical protein
MLLRIVFVAVLAVGVMLAVKSGHILRGAGLLSDCQEIPVVNGVWGELKGCSQGKLDGWRDLSDNCTSIGRYQEKEFWRCPYSPISSDA